MPNTDDPSPLQSRIEALESALEQAQQKQAEAEEKSLRALADLHNVQRREREAKTLWSDLSVMEFAKALIPSLLEMKRGLDHLTDDEYRAVVDKFFGVLEESGLAKISPEPKTPLDPDRHEVLMVAEGDPGTVVAVLEPGWTYNDRVILPAKVSAAPDS